mmetsp:Transcript_11439/g.19334  ORF Transcript_11439/g.19334 Transcript_11439/m.19334 type:complete len:111 (-) Transcript_11439:1166-1498(-)
MRTPLKPLSPKFHPSRQGAKKSQTKAERRQAKDGAAKVSWNFQGGRRRHQDRSGQRQDFKMNQRSQRRNRRQQSQKVKASKSQLAQLSMGDFEQIQVIGEGSFGKVLLVR